MTESTKITIAVLCFLVLSGLTIAIALMQAQQAELDWTNRQLEKLKNDRRAEFLQLNDPQVRKVLTKGSERGMQAMTRASAGALLLVATYAIGLGIYIFRIRRQSSPQS
ncbi:hypothetical protein [Thioalbus denitrificans]|uniref:hypothetical protein n=1 Tax=Thioalbus denitrificans TaxID=547122 RepID=UPI0011C045B3|nr:hypothetical protein [Thioalbus denitrificans]